MSDKEILKEVNLKCALKVKSEPVKKLKDILKLYSKELLNDFYCNLTKEDIDDSKQNLINKIYDKLTDETIINRFLNSLIEDEYKELIRIVENNGCIQDDYVEHNNYTCLISFGIVYTFNYQNKLYVIVPDEIMDTIKNLNINKYNKKATENSKLVKLAYSMLNLYGVVPFDVFLDNCRKYYGYKTNGKFDFDCIFLAERANSIRGIETEENIYMVKNEFLSYDEDIAIIDRIIKRLEDDLFVFDFKEIKLDDLLKYYDLFYYEETAATMEFRKYLKDSGMADEDIDLFVGSLIQSFRKDYNEGILFLSEEFEEENYDINENNIDEILSYINNIVDNIPLWGNRGWTNKEMVLGKCYK